jgi:hypothetical protein
MRSFPRLIDHCADIAIRIFNLNSNFPVEETDYTSEKKKWGHSRTTADRREEVKKERKRPKVSSYKSPFLMIKFSTRLRKLRTTLSPTFRYVSLFDDLSSIQQTAIQYYLFIFSFLCSTVTPMITICYVLYYYTGRIEPDGEQQTMSALIFYELESFSSSFGAFVVVNPYRHTHTRHTHKYGHRPAATNCFWGVCVCVF